MRGTVHVVAPGIVRSGLPLARDVAAWAALGVVSLVDLTQRERATVERACRRHGIVYSKHPLGYEFTVTLIERAALAVLLMPRPVVFHCFHGRDRTGAVAARILEILEC